MSIVPKADKREYLIVGCGSKVSCGKSHPKSDFVTIDIKEKYKPDIVGSANRDDCYKLFGEQKFNAVIYEFSKPFSDPPAPGESADPLLLQTIVKPNGMIIFLGFNPSSDFQYFKDNQSIWLALDENHELMIVSLNRKEDEKKEDKNFAVDNPALKNYLKSYWPEGIDKLTHITLTPELKLRAARLQKLEIEWGSNKLIHDAILQKPRLAPVRFDELLAIVGEYKPGKMRKLFDKETKGIKIMREILIELPGQVADPESLLKILQLIFERTNRIRSSKNLTRKTGGATTIIYEKIGAIISNYIISNPEVFDAVMLLRKPGHRQTYYP